MKTKLQQGIAPLWIVLGVVVVIAVGGYIYYSNYSSSSQPPQADNSQASSTYNSFTNSNTASDQPTDKGQSSQSSGSANTAVMTTPAPVATAPASTPTCANLLPEPGVQSFPPRGAVVLKCSYHDSATKVSTGLTLFSASEESGYTTTVGQYGSEGYTCTAIDSTTGFPASNCTEKVSGTTLDSILFTSTDGQYAVIVSGSVFGGSLSSTELQSLETLAKSVNSKI